MSTYFVTRHAAARDWARQESIALDEVIDHFEPQIIEPDDRMIGSLPVNLAADVCERGGIKLHLSMEVPKTLRGRDLSADEVRACGARIERYDIRRMPMVTEGEE